MDEISAFASDEECLELQRELFRRVYEGDMILLPDRGESSFWNAASLIKPLTPCGCCLCLTWRFAALSSAPRTTTPRSHYGKRKARFACRRAGLNTAQVFTALRHSVPSRGSCVNYKRLDVPLSARRVRDSHNGLTSCRS